MGEIIMSEEHLRVSLNKMAEELRSQFPFGHPDFVSIGLNEISLHSRKNHDYAGGGRPLGNFERAAAILKLYPNFPYDTPEGWAVLHLLKQLDAVMWGMSQRIRHKVEGLESRLGDISVYAKIIQCILRERESKPGDEGSKGKGGNTCQSTSW